MAPLNLASMDRESKPYIVWCLYLYVRKNNITLQILEAMTQADGERIISNPTPALKAYLENYRDSIERTIGHNLGWVVGSNHKQR